MRRIVNLRRQHDAAEAMAAAIATAITAYRDEYDAFAIARQLHKLNALLRLHFAVEDSVLYPEMMLGNDDEAASLARQFHDEMGALAEEIEDFTRRWSCSAAIHSRFAEFREEVLRLLAKLGARIERENDQLFPLAARIFQPRAA